MLPASVPYNRTGPEMVKILAPTPRIKPSARLSIAGETTELANPVMGTSVPAPATFAILSKIPSPVSTTAQKISVMEVKVEASSKDSINTFI